MLAAEHDDSELVCDSLRYAEPVQLDVQQPRQTPVELVGTGKDAGSSVEHSLELVSRDLSPLVYLPVRCCSNRHVM